MTPIELARKHGAEKHVIFNKNGVHETGKILFTKEQLDAYSRALVAPYVEALKLADEAMMWDVNGEPMPTKEVEARAKIADVLAAHREMFGGE